MNNGLREKMLEIKYVLSGMEQVLSPTPLSSWSLHVDGEKPFYQGTHRFSDLYLIRAEADEPRCCVVLWSRLGAKHGCNIVAIEMFWL